MDIESATWKTSFADKFKKFNELRFANLHCDITLSSKDEEEINAHRIVLHSASKFFENLFTSGLGDSTADTIKLPTIKGIHLKSIINFIYLGKIKVQKIEDVEQIMQASSYLQIEELNFRCSQFLMNVVNDTNCMKYWSLACECYQKDLEEFCITHILTYSKKFLENDSFLNELTIEGWKRILKDNRLPYTDDFKFRQMLKWIKNIANKKEEFFNILIDLLSYTNINLLSSEFIFTEIFGDDDLIGNKDFLKKISDFVRNKQSIHQLHLDSIIHYNLPSDVSPKLLSQRQQMSSRKRLLAVIGNEIGSLACDGTIEIFQEREAYTRWFGSTTFKNNLFICGGTLFPLSCSESPTNSCEYYSPYSKKFKNFPPMLTERNRHECCVLDNKIYVCGGFTRSGAITNKVEYFHFGTECWTETKIMKLSRQRFGLTTLNQSLFAVGGYDSSPNSNIEMYDTRNEQWTTVCEKFPKSDSTQCITINDDIFCFQNKNKPSIFDTRANKIRSWEGEANFVVPEYGFKVCEADGYINVVQRTNGGIDIGLYRYTYEGKLVYSKKEIIECTPKPIEALVIVTH